MADVFCHIGVSRFAQGMGKPFWTVVTVHSVTSNCINPLKIACGNGIYALLNHFLTYCAVNAQYCVNSNGLLSFS